MQSLLTQRFTLTMALLLGASGAHAVRPPDAGAGRLKSLEKAADDAVGARPVNLPESQARAPAQTLDGLARFRAAAGGSWRVILDELTGVPALIEGSGLPWVEQSGSGQAAAGQADRAALETKARALIAAHPDLFGGALSADMQLIDSATGPVLNYLYFLDFQWTHHGIPVEGAHAVFRLNHGNLVQFGSELIAAPRIAGLPARPRLSREEAAARLWNYLGTVPDAERIYETGRLLFVPAADSTGRLGYRMIWVFGFRQDGGTWEGRVDARSGEIHAFFDTTEFGHIQGGVYTTDQPASEVIKSFSFADYANNTYANAVGDFPGTAGTCAMNGDYVRITDYCGAISKASDAAGLINFGTSNGTDCTTPGTGGAGNTHAARTQYWNLDAIKQKGRTYLPANNWLQGQILARVNLTAADSPYCPANAWWDGTAVNFCVSGFGYGNTGELPGVSLHEWGHGMDRNDGNGSSSDNGSGETYGDVTAALQTHGSCIGAGFDNGNCGGYGDGCRSCTGVRDIDYNAHQSRAPHTPLNFISPNCPASASYRGPCGKEGHCESYVSSEAVWDLAVRDLTSAAGGSLDATTAWQLSDRLWYASRPSADNVFSCNATTFASNGCAIDSIYSVFRVVDDCDGNLANGTPHAAAIFNAANRHLIACGAAGDATNQNQTGCCPSLAAPTLAGSAGNQSANLSWNDITNATRYKLYRNEISCTAGFTLVATVNDPTLAHTDTPLTAGTPYYYRVQAYAASDACAGAMSNCVTVTPTSGPACSAPTGLANNTAVDASACAATGITVTWTAPTAWGDSSGTRTWTVLRNGVAVAAGPCSGALSAATLTCIDTTAVAGTAYTYTVRANNGCGMSTTTTGASATDVNGTPAAPTGVSATTNNCANITTTWTNGAGATSHNLLRYTGACPSVAGLTTFTGVTSPYVDATAASGSSYCIVARAINVCGNASAVGVTGTRAAAPAVPGAPTATAVCAGINLTWTAVGGAASYNVLRSSGACNAATQIATGVTGTAYSDTSAVPGTSYVYRLETVSGCGTSAAGACSGAAIRPAVPAPTVSGGPSGCSPVALSTQAFTTYQWLLAGNPIGGATGQNYNAVASGDYSVSVTNAGGCSATSPVSAITVNSVPAAPVQSAAIAGNQQVTANWALSGGATGYQVRRGNAGGPYSNAGPLQSGATTSYLDTPLTNGTQYCYVIQASGACGTSANSNERCATPASCVVTAGFSDNMETVGTPNWTLSGGTNPNWVSSTAAAGSPTTSLRGADAGSNPGRNKCGFAQQSTTPVALSAGASSAQLSFWSQTAMAADDNGIVEISTDGGTSWAKLTTVNYPATVSTFGTATCLAAMPAVNDPVFTGTRAGATYNASLNAFLGQSVLVRFSYVTGGTASAGSNWFVDDVTISEGNGVALTMSTVTQGKSGSDLVENWSAVAGTDNYNVYRALTANPGSWGAPVATPAGAAVNWTDAGQLSSAVTQFYTVTTANGCGESPQ